MSVYPLALATILAFVTSAAAEAYPAQKPMADMPGMSMPSSAATTGKGTGVVTAIDQKAATISIKHQPIVALGWPAMTMTFKATPAALLKGIKVGQKIAFDANQGRGVPEITAIRKP